MSKENTKLINTSKTATDKRTEVTINDNNAGNSHGLNNEVPTETPNDSSAAEEGESTPLNFCGQPRKKKIILILFCSSYFAYAVGYGQFAPFYPTVAQQKGMSKVEVGVVFSVYQFIFFISTPFYGAYLTKIGPKFTFNGGFVVSGLCTILFGFLDRCPYGVPFFVLCLLTRTLESLGMAAFVTAIVSLACTEFKGHEATVIGIMELFVGLGYMIGPVIGGLLYEAGGFGLSFYVTGSWILFNGVLIFLLLPGVDECAPREQGAFSLLMIPKVLISMINITLISYAIGFLEPTLSQHVQGLGLPIKFSGFVFMIWPALYAAGSPIWGWVADTKGLATHLVVGGSAICGLGFLLVGPSPWLPFIPRALWVVIIALFIIGTALGSTLIPNLKCMMDGAVEGGWKNNIETYGVISGNMLSSFALGTTIGPTAGGAMAQNLGFDMGVTINALVYFGLSLSSFLFHFVYEPFRKRKASSSSNNSTSTSNTNDTSLSIGNHRDVGTNNEAWRDDFETDIDTARKGY